MDFALYKKNHKYHKHGYWSIHFLVYDYGIHYQLVYGFTIVIGFDIKNKLKIKSINDNNWQTTNKYEVS